MKTFFGLMLLVSASLAHAITWTYQVNVNNKTGPVQKMSTLKNTFEAGPYPCEVTPIFVNNNTEYRTLTCGVGTSTVSTGGLCTRKSAKFSSVQFAILNLNNAKNMVNVVVACKF